MKTNLIENALVGQQLKAQYKNKIYEIVSGDLINLTSPIVLQEIATFGDTVQLEENKSYFRIKYENKVRASLKRHTEIAGLLADAELDECGHLVLNKAKIADEGRIVLRKIDKAELTKKSKNKGKEVVRARVPENAAAASSHHIASNPVLRAGAERLSDTLSNPVFSRKEMEAMLGILRSQDDLLNQLMINAQDIQGQLEDANLSAENRAQLEHALQEVRETVEFFAEEHMHNLQNLQERQSTTEELITLMRAHNQVQTDEILEKTRLLQYKVEAIEASQAQIEQMNEHINMMTQLAALRDANVQLLQSKLDALSEKSVDATYLIDELKAQQEKLNQEIEQLKDSAQGEELTKVKLMLLKNEDALKNAEKIAKKAEKVAEEAKAAFDKLNLEQVEQKRVIDVLSSQKLALEEKVAHIDADHNDTKEKVASLVSLNEKTVKSMRAIHQAVGDSHTHATSLFERTMSALRSVEAAFSDKFNSFTNIIYKNMVEIKDVIKSLVDRVITLETNFDVLVKDVVSIDQHNQKQDKRADHLQERISTLEGQQALLNSNLQDMSEKLSENEQRLQNFMQATAQDSDKIRANFQSKIDTQLNLNLAMRAAVQQLQSNVRTNSELMNAMNAELKALTDHKEAMEKAQLNLDQRQDRMEAQVRVMFQDAMESNQRRVEALQAQLLDVTAKQAEDANLYRREIEALNQRLNDQNQLNQNLQEALDNGKREVSGHIDAHGARINALGNELARMRAPRAIVPAMPVPVAPPSPVLDLDSESEYSDSDNDDLDNDDSDNDDSDNEANEINVAPQLNNPDGNNQGIGFRDVAIGLGVLALGGAAALFFRDNGASPVRPTPIIPGRQPAPVPGDRQPIIPAQGQFEPVLPVIVPVQMTQNAQTALMRAMNYAQMHGGAIAITPANVNQTYIAIDAHLKNTGLLSHQLAPMMDYARRHGVQGIPPISGNDAFGKLKANNIVQDAQVLAFRM